MTDCSTNCPVPIKNNFLGCIGRPMVYKKERPRLKEFERQLMIAGTKKVTLNGTRKRTLAWF